VEAWPPLQIESLIAPPQVLDRYGGRSAMWLWRRLQFDPKFPRPTVLGNRNYFNADELDAYDAAARKVASNAIAAA
jgi:predicted DNA-binding transcriptional regulator AlpA